MGSRNLLERRRREEEEKTTFICTFPKQQESFLSFYLKMDSQVD